MIGNDALQTLGPFLAASRGRIPRPLQAAFLCAVLCLVLLLGWSLGGGDPAWGRLERFPLPDQFGWVDLLPPLAVLALTQQGAPVSTSFLVLTAFSPANLPELLGRSLAGYGLALLSGALVYGSVGWLLERPAPPEQQRPQLWLILQWAATGWLWGQWLVQDLANLYVYLPRQLDGTAMALSLAALCGGVCLLLAEDGGAIRERIRSKRNVEDPRSSTLIAAVYGLILFGLARLSPQPLSTTWVFLGLLAGRELALLMRLGQRSGGEVAVVLAGDVARSVLGLAVSVAVALAVPLLREAL
ncbi:MAG: hypothetical protein ACKO6F_06125 [Cyanobium sp.]